jgi:hypothetical protein
MFLQIVEDLRTLVNPAILGEVLDDACAVENMDLDGLGPEELAELDAGMAMLQRVYQEHLDAGCTDMDYGLLRDGVAELSQLVAAVAVHEGNRDTSEQ